MVGSSGDLGDLVQRGYRFALSLTHEEARAEDLVQDAWFSVFKARGPWTREYLFATIRNRFIDQYRRERIVETEPLNDREGESIDPDAPLWGTGGGEFMLNGALTPALRELRAEERAVLYLAAVEDYTARQIAELFGWPRGTVLAMLHRTRNKIRRLVQAESGSKA